jgi:acyl carrier protein
LTRHVPPGARPRSGHANIHAEVSVRLTWWIEEDTPDDKGKSDASSNGVDVTSDEWDERFESLVRDHLPFLAADEELQPDLDLREFGLDALRAVELLVALESVYGVRMGDEAMSMHTFATPAALWAALRGKRSATDLSAPR